MSAAQLQQHRTQVVVGVTLQAEAADMVVVVSMAAASMVVITRLLPRS
jgi:hypothetical protein